MWWTAILGFFNNSIVQKILGYALIAAAGAAIVWGAYTFAYDKGFDAAKSQCQAAAIQGQLNAETQKYNQLLQQYNDAQVQINNTTNQKKTQEQNANNATQVINNEVKDNTQCDLNSNAVSVLNSLRNGSPSSSATNSPK